MLPDIQPGNTKILYFFNCLLDGMHTNNTKRFIIKIPKKAKFKGIKSFTIYMSKKKDTGYKKYKKVKPGTTVTISSFKKKKFKTAKDFYYIKIVPNLTKKVSSDTYVYVYQ